jgi:hypothetical protein
MRKTEKKAKQNRRAEQSLSPSELQKVTGGSFGPRGDTANEVLLNAWWDAGATQ